MTASSRGSRAAASLIRSSRSPRQTICSDCLNRTSRRNYAVAATAMKTLDSSPDKALPHLKQMPPVTSSASEYKTQAGVLLSRPPLLTAPQTSFEKAFFFYQKRLNERLAMPFTRYFYFKADTPADTDWKIKAKERNGAPARELGGYRGYGADAWHDELLSTDAVKGQGGTEMGKLGLAEPKWIVESLVKDSKIRAVEGKDGAPVEVEEGMEEAKDLEVEKPMSRFSEADRKNDMKRLDRAMTRTLYLLVQGQDEKWTFPSGDLVGRENLHQAAERLLVQAAGVNMNTWIVGHVPAGHYIRKPERDTKTGEIRVGGLKTFFMKGRMMAGQADLSANLLGLKDYKWLTKEETAKIVDKSYWGWVKNMLADR